MTVTEKWSPADLTRTMAKRLEAFLVTDIDKLSLCDVVSAEEDVEALTWMTMGVPTPWLPVRARPTITAFIEGASDRALLWRLLN